MTPQQVWTRTLTSVRPFVTILFFIIVVLLLSLEASAWRNFNWSLFVANAKYVSLSRALIAVAFIHLGFLLRAVRWNILLHPVRAAQFERLIGPTIIGFAGLALLGRPGEIVRPYLISRKFGLSMSSQLATLTIERIFDSGCAGILILIAILASSKAGTLPYEGDLRGGSLLFLALMAALAFIAFLMAKTGKKLGHLLGRALSPLPKGLAEYVTRVLGSFSSNLNAIRDARSAVKITILSIAIWLFVGVAYLETIHAFGGLRVMSFGDAVLLMGCALLGSFVQLPGGGTHQLITVAALIQVFGVPTELAVSCGILGWLTIYMAPVPLGMFMLRYEQLSLRALLQIRTRQSMA